ncbi:MAG: dihydroorotate dehydrogenase [Acidobacteriota bacterium]|jgi:dihydroorotate dehydrogenase (NAD+) catalytic subunit
MSAVDLRVRIGEVELSNPVIAASGTVGYGEELAEIVDLDKLGGIVVKGLSMHVERGNPTPRIVETPGGMLNSIGLQNVGADVFLTEKLPFLRRFDTTVIANIWGRTVDEYVQVAERLDGAEGLAALELNISCPNIKEGGISFGTDPVQTEQVTRAVREASSLPLWVKLTPGVTDIGVLARAAEAGGADALSVINTLRGMTVNVATRRPTLATTFGGLSGPAILPIALYMVFETRRATSLPIIGIGGIEGIAQALQFFIIGASAVQIGTANFYDPTATERLVDELAAWCAENGVGSIDELVGTLQHD